jgi:2-polyprenyl-6-methoxyphenol hydroxylase-like FAD-dependent oxidoreductase
MSEFGGRPSVLAGAAEHDDEMHSGTPPLKPLRIVIVGAGIGGLVAAIALRQIGHDITILEQWGGANDTGAAIHIAPNANGLLRRLGLYAETFGANVTQRTTNYGQDGSVQHSMELEERNQIWQHPWLLCHRIHLHSNLSKAATSDQGKGKPADLRYSQKVTNVDPKNGIVFMENGDQVEGDLVIGADGVSSITRKLVEGGHVVPFSSGKSAFRFLVSRDKILEDESTKKFAVHKGELTIIWARDRRIISYPCQNNELLNFVCIHPDNETAAPSDDWNAGGNLQKLLEVYKDFDKPILDLLAKADPQTLKVWKLLDMEKLPTWINGKLALLGDAAHPFLPHQGQGGGIAMEDAISLSVVLPLGTKPEEVAERLKVYQTCRYERAHAIQHFTRLAGKDLDDPDKVDSKFRKLHRPRISAENNQQWSDSSSTILVTTSSITPPKCLTNGDTLKIPTYTGECRSHSVLCLDLAKPCMAIQRRERTTPPS